MHSLIFGLKFRTKELKKERVQKGVYEDAYKPISLWFFLAKNLYYIDTARRANLEELMYLGFLLVTLVNKPTVVKQRFAGSPKPDWPTTYLTR
jgi:hypothetical protein